MKDNQRLKKVSMHYKFQGDGDGWEEYKERFTAVVDCIKAKFEENLDTQLDSGICTYNGFDIKMKEKDPQAMEAPLRKLFASAGHPYCVFWRSDFECVERALPPGKTLKRKFETLYFFAKHVVDAE